MVRCPNGHESTDTDYCSVCGVAIVAATAPTAAPPGAGGGGGMAAAVTATGARGSGNAIAPMLNVCPDCSTPRSDMNARFCEVCRYDFETLESYDPANDPASAPVPAPPPAPPSAPTLSPPTAPPMTGGIAANMGNGATAPVAPSVPVLPITSPADPDPAPAATHGPTWEVRVTVDGSLDTEPDPDLPVPQDEPDYFFPLAHDEMLIGRRDDRQQIRPQIPLRDPGVSRRHAMLHREADGVSVMDLGSTNGTSVNGEELPPNSRRMLKDGDTITIGRWTRITLRGGA